ncbi:cell division protein FtsX [Mesohalobacter halotolerans]|uniref:Cell division protein FtsX n=1 Tax=Mesohalobacter halotolerans TaxID=1883405 RepID=A0A4U5TS30_9FLAO|nr:permease-like cell division protein FtsX [Mesohalobacter halotolerans]MBS3738096.1 permease-like cell division protein FtsX [Psychroflexus sp.]TKS57089.1 FtsX-like permease family protein [Mesohalobacter halotolerans]
MARSFEKYQKRRLISSYISVVISIGLVLFLVGLLGILVINTQKVANHFKEQIAMSIYLKDQAKEIEIDQLQKQLALADYTKNTVYTSKEEAAEIYKQDIGEDFMNFLGDANPLPQSIDVYFNADYVNEVQLAEIARDLSEKDFVAEIVYDKPLIALLNNNIKKISFWVLVICGIFTFIAVLLINSSIRLSVYSKRFVIKTMQMVGATKSFIRRPFIWKSVKLGMLGAVLALLSMAAVLYFLDQSYPELDLLVNELLLGGLFIAVFLLGVLITWFSTFLATQRFLNLKTDELYY